MNLRQQFFWKILLGLSVVVILFSAFRSYSKYSEYIEYRKEYEKESEVQDNKIMENKTNFISDNQQQRIKLFPDYIAIDEKLITNHVRAGIKSTSKSDWESNDPIYRGMTNGRAMIDYRDDKGNFYKEGQKIYDTDMIVDYIDKDSVIINYPKGKRVFYIESYKNFNNNK